MIIVLVHSAILDIYVIYSRIPDFLSLKNDLQKMIKRRGCNEDKEKLRREAETGTIVEVNTGILNLHLHVSSQVVKNNENYGCLPE